MAHTIPTNKVDGIRNQLPGQLQFIDNRRTPLSCLFQITMGNRRNQLYGQFQLTDSRQKQLSKTNPQLTRILLNQL